MARTDTTVLTGHVTRGIQLINRLIFTNDRVLAREIVDGKHNHDLECMLYYAHYGVHPHAAICVNDSNVQNDLNGIRTDLRYFADKYRYDANSPTLEALRVNANLVKYTGELRHHQAAEGSVSDLAARFNKSKSEIRRLKAAGLLGTLVRGENQ